MLNSVDVWLDNAVLWSDCTAVMSLLCCLFQVPTTRAWRPCSGSWPCTMQRTRTTCSVCALRRASRTWVRARSHCAHTTRTDSYSAPSPWPAFCRSSSPAWTWRTVSLSWFSLWSYLISQYPPCPSIPPSCSLFLLLTWYNLRYFTSFFYDERIQHHLFVVKCQVLLFLCGNVESTV